VAFGQRDERGDDLRVLSSESHQVVATVPVRKRPRGLCLARTARPSSPRWATKMRLALVDVASRALLRKVPVGRDPEQVVSLSPRRQE